MQTFEKKRLSIALLAGSVLLLPALAAARDYRVEMLFFVHQNPGAAQAEHWSSEAPPPSITDAVDLGNPDAEGFSSLSSSTFKLGGARNALEQSPDYRVLEHLSWRQPGLPPDSARPVHIEAGPDYSGRFPQSQRDKFREADNGYEPTDFTDSLRQLEGMVEVKLRRYLHVETDLVYRQPGGEANRLIEARVRNFRRMRSGELHYLDHPLLGILVQITPVE